MKLDVTYDTWWQLCDTRCHLWHLSNDMRLTYHVYLTEIINKENSTKRFYQMFEFWKHFIDITTTFKIIFDLLIIEKLSSLKKIQPWLILFTARSQRQMIVAHFTKTNVTSYKTYPLNKNQNNSHYLLVTGKLYHDKHISLFQLIPVWLERILFSFMCVKY